MKNFKERRQMRFPIGKLELFSHAQNECDERENAMWNEH